METSQIFNYLLNEFSYISTNIKSSPIQRIFSQSITMSFSEDRKLIIFPFPPGTIIDVVVAKLMSLLFYGTAISIIAI